jgi:hypothetical protein
MIGFSSFFCVESLPRPALDRMDPPEAYSPAQPLGKI